MTPVDRHDDAPSFTVTELAAAINDTLADRFGSGLWVSGEIHNWSDRTQHAYFSLIEKVDGASAKIDIKFFAGRRRSLRPLLERHRLELADGLRIRVFGTLDFWATGGSLGLVMSDIDPRYTLGEMALARDEVLRALKASGRFDKNRSLPLSPVPLRLAVVTGVGTAAWHDFTDELERSGLGFRVYAYDTPVQGDAAIGSITRAIVAASRRTDIDAVVVIRGGGARNELAVFDAPGIASAILDSTVPVITGIGHEIDVSIADEVAHTPLKTPTACAAFLIDSVRTHARRIEERWSAISILAERRLDRAHHDLRDRAQRVARHTDIAVERADLRLGQRAERLDRDARRLLVAGVGRLDRAAAVVARQPAIHLERAERGLDLLAARIAAHDPALLMARGWSITTGVDGAVIRSVDDVTPGSPLVTRVADGAITSTVESAGRTS